MSELLQWIVLAASVVILVRAEPALNRMSRCTPLLVRFSFWLLAIGAIGQILFVASGGKPSIATALMAVGIAMLLVCERRLRQLCPMPKRGAPT